MAKDYRRGLSYQLYYNGATYANPNWARIHSVDDLSIDPDIEDIEVPERGISMGHLHGKGNMTFTFTLMEDAGDENVEKLIAATLSDATMIHLGVCAPADLSVGPAPGDTIYHMETKISGSMDADQSEVAAWDMTAMRHGNSGNEFKRETIEAPGP